MTSQAGPASAASAASAPAPPSVTATGAKPRPPSQRSTSAAGMAAPVKRLQGGEAQAAAGRPAAVGLPPRRQRQRRAGVEGAGEHLAAGHLGDQRRRPVGGRPADLGVGAALEAVAGVGVEAEAAGGGAHRVGLEVGALEQNRRGGGSDFGRLAAHHPGQRHRPLGVGDHQHGRGERPHARRRGWSAPRPPAPGGRGSPGGGRRRGWRGRRRGAAGRSPRGRSW